MAPFHRKRDGETPHPGTVLRELLNERGISPLDLAVETGVDAHLITRMLNSTYYPTPNVSLALGASLGKGKDYFLKLARAHRDVTG
jgi:plasmid maintenance system antidote protein VapI